MICFKYLIDFFFFVKVFFDFPFLIIIIKNSRKIW